MPETPDEEFVLVLPPGVEAASVARRFVVEQAHAVPHGLVADAELLVSELVTNAVLHGRPVITLRVNFEPPAIGVSVEDAGDILPSHEPTAASVTATHGRGLHIVDALATSWGIEANDSGPGKTVWFHLGPTQAPA